MHGQQNIKFNSFCLFHVDSDKWSPVFDIDVQLEVPICKTWLWCSEIQCGPYGLLNIYFLLPLQTAFLIVHVAISSGGTE